LAAREAGASVLLLEAAPRELRGGNSRHARNLRLAHDRPNALMRDSYTAEAYWDDLARVTGGETCADLARLAIARSADAACWMQHCGARFERTQRSRRTAFLLGGGKALLNAYYRTAERLGVAVRYDTHAVALPLDAGEVAIITGGIPATVRAKAIVVACGGMQANIDWLRQDWGEAAGNFLIRGSRHADGRILRDLLGQGAASVGKSGQCHIVAIDARAPLYDGGIVTRVDGVPFGVVVDRDGKRFHDESESVGPERHAIWGSLIARCPGQIAHAIFDAAAEKLFRPSIHEPIRAPTLAELAVRLAIDPPTLAATVQACTVRRIVEPPFSAISMRPGITFGYLGVKVDEAARVLISDDSPSGRIFAAGQIMAANILGQGYLAGMGLTIGTVFGRIAGREAARVARV
jgi:tricarballylate dehydrogenase